MFSDFGCCVLQFFKSPTATLKSFVTVTLLKLEKPNPAALVSRPHTPEIINELENYLVFLSYLHSLSFIQTVVFNHFVNFLQSSRFVN